MPKGPTSYKGLLVTENEKEQLKSQPIGNFLRYEKEGDNYIIQQKFPEVGTFNGVDYNPRRAMNALTKGLGSLFDDENKIIDFKKLNEKFTKIDQIIEALNQIDGLGEKGAAKYDRFLEHLFKEMDIPKEEIPNTKPFIKALGSDFRYMFIHVVDDVDNIRSYNTFVSKINDIPENKRDDYKQFIHDSKESITKLQDRLFCLKKINIAENDKLIYSSDCAFSSKITEIVANSYNEYCNTHEEYKGKNLNGQKEEIFLDEVKFDKEKEELNFAAHVIFGENVTVDGKNLYLTLETTAPGVNELAHEPDKQKTGVGLYESKEDAVNYYKKSNVTEKPKIDKNYFTLNDYVKTTYPIIDKKQLESMKPKEPGGFYKFCHKYFNWFTKKFDEYNAKLERYEQTKQFFEAENKISDHVEKVNNGHIKKLDLEDHSFASQKLNSIEIQGLNLNKQAELDPTQL